MKGEIKIVLLINEDRIIGTEIVPDTESIMYLEDPMEIQFMAVEEGRLAPVLLPYLPYSQDNIIKIFKRNLLAEPYEPLAQFKRLYEDQITKLKAARSNIVMANMVPPAAVNKMGNVVKL